MKDINTMISVMQAYAEGKTIEFWDEDISDWKECAHPVWNWDSLDYRVKPEPHYRPYANAEECFADVQKHGGWVKENRRGCYFTLASIGNSGYAFAGGSFRMYEKLMADYAWADDGSPCGAKEE